MSKISVIIPIYKVEKFLRQCLDSVVNQTFRDLEIILIDDCSPDNCGKICDEYGKRDKRIRILHKTERGGLSAARNSGLKMATGEWILFVDSDDWCELTLCEEAIAKANETDADIVMFSHFLNTKNKEVAIHSFAEEFETDDPTFISQLQLSVLTGFENPIPSEAKWSQGLPWDKLYKSSLIIGNDLKFAENVKANEDLIFNVHAFQFASKVCFRDELLYHWRMNAGSIGHQYNPNRAAVDLDVYFEFSSIGKKYGLPKTYYQVMDELLVMNATLLGIRYFFNPQNKKPLREKFKEANKVLHSEPWWSAIQTVDEKRVSRPAKVMLLWRKNPVFMLYLVAGIQKLKSRYWY